MNLNELLFDTLVAVLVIWVNVYTLSYSFFEYKNKRMNTLFIFLLLLLADVSLFL